MVHFLLSVRILLTVLLGLPPAYGDRHEPPLERAARMTNVAQGITSATEEATCTGPFTTSPWCKPVWGGSTQDLEALLVEIGDDETHFAKRIGQGRCARWECDGGHARHYWQNWVNAWVSRETWDQLQGTEVVPTTTAALAAATVLGEGLKRCRSIEGAIAFYARSACRWDGAKARYASFVRIRSALADGARLQEDPP